MTGMVITVTRERTTLRAFRPASQSRAWYWVYSATGPDTITVGERELPRRFDNRSLVELRRVLRRAYGRDVQIIESWKEGR